MNRKILRANEGMILTNGETYGTEIFLADGVSEDDFREIPMKEYEEMIMREYEEMEIRQ